MVHWGRTAAGTPRYHCPVCSSTRIYHSSIPSESPLFPLFRHYVLWGNTYEQLASLSGYSVGHLVRVFHTFLSTTPLDLPLLDQSSYEVTYLLIDGLWFGRWFVLMVYRQSKNLTILRISVAGKEVATKISKDLQVLRNQYRFTGVVSDGGTGITKAITMVLGHIPHQRCLAHLHRQATSALGRYPKDDRVKQLKMIADHLWLIESKEALRWWTKELNRWVRNHWRYLRERKYDDQGHWWYIHKGVRKTVRILVSAPDTSFTFLDHPLMPKTTNEIEAQFGHLAKRWLAHRGLKRSRWELFLKWFVYFYNQEKLAASKRERSRKSTRYVN